MSLSAPASDWHGRPRAYLRLQDGATGQSLRALAERPLMLDRVGIQTAWGQAAAHDRTVLAPLRRLSPAPPPPGPAPDDDASSWSQAFEAAVRRVAATAPAPALALGGGVDAAAVLAAWRTTGTPLPSVLTVQTGVEGYDEVEQASAMAAALGATVHPVPVTPAELVAHLPTAVAAAETPLYNLHPVTRLGLARAARARGFLSLVTGDGADAIFRGQADLDYVPVVAALTASARLTLASPFFDPQLVAATLALGPDPAKRPLREYLRAHGVFDPPKRPRWMPPLDLSAHLSLPLVRRLEAALSLRAELDTDRGRVGWVTLGLLVRSLGGVG
jgi:asparagine synthase (glutamine-hydrolysing)